MEIGVRLKEAREDKGLSLESLQDTTKIQKRYLVAIEQGEFHILPGKFYARAFIKEYAIAVDLDPDELLEEYKSEIPSTEDESTVQYTRIQRSNRESRRERNPASFSFIPTIIVVLLVIAIIFAAWIFYQKSTTSNSDPVQEQGDDEIFYSSDGEDSEEKDEDQTDDADDENKDEEAEDDSTEKESESKEPEFSVVEEGTGNSPESELDLNNVTEDVKVELKASGNSYLEVKGGSGEIFFTGMVTADQTLEEINVGDEEKVYFNVGNASALEIKINGAKLEYPIKPEEIVHQKLWVNLNKE